MFSVSATWWSGSAESIAVRISGLWRNERDSTKQAQGSMRKTEIQAFVAFVSCGRQVILFLHSGHAAPDLLTVSERWSVELALSRGTQQPHTC